MDDVRREASLRLAPERKSQLGQFLTPSNVARYLASLFPDRPGPVSILDAGAGIGSLTAAFLDRWLEGSFRGPVRVTAFEVDPMLSGYLRTQLEAYGARARARGLTLAIEIVQGDFVEEAVNRIQFRSPPFTHAVLNPPYKKINSGSRHRHLLSCVGIETVNLYSAFTALTARLLAPGGELVAIIPRSFCNGAYYRPFRDLILTETALRHIHLFSSRREAFKEDGVLQENVVLRLTKGASQEEVEVSTSSDDTFSDYASHVFPFGEIVNPSDRERFIHVPTDPEPPDLDALTQVRFTLQEIGVDVSTGPVVDFRVKQHLRADPEPGTAPLLYPGHFGAQSLEWPKDGKKPNAIQVHPETAKGLYPAGWYVVVRRFSSEEERRRVVAHAVEPLGYPAVGFENHLNVFHQGKRGVPAELAHGLAAFLNSTPVDEYFRRFSGHTQVNATDLRGLNYPGREALVKLGRWAEERRPLAQEAIDAEVAKLG